MAAVCNLAPQCGHVGKLRFSICPYEGLVCIARALARPLNRLLRHSGSGLGGIRGVRGAQCTANGKRQRVGGALRYHGPCIFISFSALEQGGTLRGGALPPALSFLGCKATLVPLSFPSPLVTRGRVLKKAVKSTAYLFPVPF